MVEAVATWVDAWKPAVPGVREVLHARFGSHAYPPHVHDTWTLFVVDRGSVRYDLDGRDRGARPDDVSLLPPHVVHDGRPGSPGGYRKRVLYLEPQLIEQAVIGQTVDRPVVPVPGLAGRLGAIHDRLRCAEDGLEAETRLALIVEEIRAAYGSVDEPRLAATGELAEALRAVLERDLTGRLTLADAGLELGASPTHLARSFRRTFGIAPHAWVLARRLDLARGRILGGEPLAAIAADLGFVDQAHLTRRFRRLVGTTPGRYRARRARRDAIA
jgi:AraC-like DNA-binding protein